jgi:hypothetical protein
MENNKKRLYVREIEDWRREAYKKRFSEHELQVQELSQAILLPPDNWNSQTGEFQGGVCDSKGNFIAGLMREKPPQAGFYGVASAYPVAEADILYRDEDVVFGGILIGHFGHFILECLGRLWYVLQHKEQHKRIVFLTELEVCEWYFKFFALLGLPQDRILLIEQPTRFRSVIVPEESVHSWYDYTKEYLLPYQVIVQQAQKRMTGKSLWKKIFLTRNGLTDSQTKCVNEVYFCKYFAAHGFIPVELETLPLAEQVAIVSQADEIAAVLGSLTHWALFCRPGTKFTMLTRTSNDILGSQCLINEAAQVDWYIVDTAMNIFYANRAVGVCLIGPTIFWQEYVRDQYGIIEEDDSWKNAYHEYLREWSDYMLQPQKWETIRKLDPLALLTRINKALHQNELVLPNEKDAGSVNFVWADDEAAYYWDEGLNSLLSIRLADGARTVCYPSPVREFPAPLYGMPVKVGRYFVLTPENSSSVLTYDWETGKAAAIPLPAPLPRGNFRYAVSYGNWVIMTGHVSGRIIACDPQNKEIRYLLELAAEELKACGRENAAVFGKPCLLSDMLYVPIIDTNQVLELNLTEGSYKIHHVGVEEAAYGFAAAYAGNIWLAPSQGGPLAVWNPPTGVMQIIDRFPADVHFAKVAGKIRFFADIIVDGAYLWLLPWGADKILRVNMENGHIETVPLALGAQKPCVTCGCLTGNKLVLGMEKELKIYDLGEEFLDIG